MNANINQTVRFELHANKDEVAAYENLEDEEPCHQRQL